ncbi:MAG: hypothetical protein AAGG45_06745, partial [Pseudomonadota bacterium]
MTQQTGRGMSYPAYLAGLFILWPVVAYMGGQGFTAGVALAAIPVLFYVRPKSIPLYAIAFILFMLWVIASSTWSGVERGLFEGSLASQDFELNDASLRLGLTALCIGGVIFAATQVQAYAPKALAFFKAVTLVQAIGVVTTALCMGAILDALSPYSDPITEMPQNMMRNVNAMTLILPLLSAWLWSRGSLSFRVAAIVWPIAIGMAGFVIGSWASVISIFMIGAAIMVVWVFRRIGFLLLFTFLGVYIMLAPYISGSLTQALRGSG